MSQLPILVAGDAVADVYPVDRLALGDGTLSLYPGGTGANVAVGLARLYAPPHFHTTLGSDRFADLLADAFRAAGIDDALVRRVEGDTSMAALERGDDAIDWGIYHQPSTLALDADVVPDDRLAAVDAVHLTGITLGSPAGHEATVELARRGAARGCTVSVDLNARANMWDGPADYRAAVEPLLEHADVVFASADDFATAGVDGDHEARLEWLHDRGAGTAFLTLGADGAGAGDGDRRAHHPGFAVDAVNPAGAGDAFAAGVLGTLEAALPDLLAVGNAAGALATTADSPTEPLERDRIRALLDGDALAAFDRAAG